jgi:protein-tyrosine phosphatase
MVKAPSAAAPRASRFSAATIGDHAGNPPHAKAQAAMRRRNIDISRLRSRKITPQDFWKFDWIIVLDRGSLRYVRSLADESSRANVALLMDFTEDWAERDVPDPLLSKISFDVVTEMIEDACFDLLYELGGSFRQRLSLGHNASRHAAGIAMKRLLGECFDLDRSFR